MRTARELRLLLVWTVAIGMAAVIAWAMVFLGTLEVHRTWRRDLVFGVALGVLTQLGLVLSPRAEGRGAAARVGAALLMLPCFGALASVITERVQLADWPGIALPLAALSVYAVQLWCLGGFALARAR